MDGWIEPATEAVLSAVIEPSIDLTLHESRDTKLSDSSPATDSEPPAPVESHWAPIMEFTSADIFQHSPFGDILNSLRSLSLSGESWPNYVRQDWDADGEFLRPPHPDPAGCSSARTLLTGRETLMSSVCLRRVSAKKYPWR